MVSSVSFCGARLFVLGWSRLDLRVRWPPLPKTPGVLSRSRGGSLVSVVVVDCSVVSLRLEGAGKASSSHQMARLLASTAEPRAPVLPFWSGVTGLLVGVDLPVKQRVTTQDTLHAIAGHLAE